MLQSINENAMESKQTLSVPACRLLKFLFRAGSQNHGMRLVSEKQIPARILQRLHFYVPEKKAFEKRYTQQSCVFSLYDRGKRMQSVIK